MGSYAGELGVANHYDPPSLLRALVLGGQSNLDRFHDRVACPTNAVTYERLATLTQRDIPTLHALTPHRFAPILMAPGYEARTLDLSDGTRLDLLPTEWTGLVPLRSDRACQYCPFCVAELPQHRLIWTPTLVSACVRHECLLVLGCHACGRTTAAQAIVVGHCGWCGADLRDAPTTSVAGDDDGLTAQRIIQAWFGDGSTPDWARPLVPDQPPNVLYRVIDGLQHHLQGGRRPNVTRGGTGWTYTRRGFIASYVPALLRDESLSMTPYRSYHMTSAVVKSLRAWPAGFHTFLDAYRERDDARDAPGHDNYNYVLLDLAGLYGLWMRTHWNHPAFAFVHEAFEGYVTARLSFSQKVKRSVLYHNGLLRAEKFVYIGIGEAAKIIGTNPEMVIRLLDAGVLARHDTEDKPKYGSVSRVEAKSLGAVWASAPSRPQVMARLGTGPHIVEDLADAGLLAVVNKPGGKGKQHWAFDPVSVEVCHKRFSDNVTRLDTEAGVIRDDLITILDVAHIIQAVDMRAIAALVRVVEGTLAAYHPVGGEVHLADLLFVRGDIEAWVAAVKDEQGWVNQEEARAIIGVVPKTFVFWMRQKLIAPVASRDRENARYFDRAEIEGFWDTYVTARDAAAIVGVHVHQLLKWTRQGVFEGICVSGRSLDNAYAYLFDRMKLIRWREGHMTQRELVTALGVTRFTVHNWEKAGRFARIPELGPAPWYARSATLIAPTNVAPA